MKRRYILFIDALINFILGILLLFYSPALDEVLGMPHAARGFYANILGGIFIGITAALLVEMFRKKPDRFIGLGLLGALCINICGGLVLTAWLMLGDLALPLRGFIILWSLAGALVVVSSLELYLELRGSAKN